MSGGTSKPESRVFAFAKKIASLDELLTRRSSVVDVDWQ